MSSASTAVATAVEIENATTQLDNSKLQELADFIHEGWIILWQHHAVFAIPVQDAQFEKPKEMEDDLSLHLVRVRAFSLQREWHIWRSNDCFQGRKRIDQADVLIGETTFVDTQMKLRGVIVAQLSSSAPLEEWVLHTRNYIGYNQYHLAGYVDSRFMMIEKIREENGI